jgi:hypothetical protein
MSRDEYDELYKNRSKKTGFGRGGGIWRSLNALPKCHE